MANLTFNEKQIFEKLFNRGGYVLDFSNRTFAEFFNDFNIDIEAEKYHKNGTSKMNRLRAFWEIEPDRVIGEVLEKLLEYANLIEIIEEKDNLQAKKYIYRLLGKKIPDDKKELSEDDFLNKEFNEIDLTLLNFDFKTESILKQRLKEIETCLKNGASLSVIFLCGSTLEGILLNIASKNPKDFNTAKSTPKNNDKVKLFHEWNLNNLIDVAYEKNYIGLDIKKFSHALRDFRNFIHPFQQANSNFNPDKHTAEISWKVLQATIDNLVGNRKKGN